MLFSFAVIFMAGLLAGGLFSKVKLPPLMGMLIAGIVIGPHCMDRIDSSVLNISAQLRQIALIIILLRAGLNLKIDDLKKVGRPAVLMCFVPATFEIIGTLIFAPLIFHMTLMESLILGTVIAAVSPAVIVPHMLKIMEKGYGTAKGIPQMILAGASADDVFVIVLFTSFTELARSGAFEASTLLRIPTSILLGILAGAAAGFVLCKVTEKLTLDSTKTILVFLCLAFLLVSAENAIQGPVGFSGLIATMTIGISFSAKSQKKASAVSSGLSRLWTAAEILLFVLVGAAVDIRYAVHAGGWALLLIFAVLLFRMAGVLVCVAGTKLNMGERLFTMLAYTPKATVQAAIGAVPLSMGLSCGTTVLTMAVVAILVTAPLGAFLIDLTYDKLLSETLPEVEAACPDGG